MNNFLSLLGLASRARKIVTGETLIKKIRTNAIYLVIIASDASDNTKKKFIDKILTFIDLCCIIKTTDISDTRTIRRR